MADQALRESVEKLSDAVAGMSVEAQMLRHEVRVVDRKRALMWVPIIVGAAVILLVVLVVIQNRRTAHVLIECTTPSEADSVHECYERGLKVQQDFLNQQRDILDELRNLRAQVQVPANSSSPPTTTDARTQPSIIVTPSPTGDRTIVVQPAPQSQSTTPTTQNAPQTQSPPTTRPSLVCVSGQCFL